MFACQSTTDEGTFTFKHTHTCSLLYQGNYYKKISGVQISLTASSNWHTHSQYLAQEGRDRNITHQLY